MLGQNYPNPYRDGTTIPFLLLHPSDIKLELWDLSGRKLTTIEKNDLAAGEHSIQVNHEDLGLSRGNYIYQLEVNNSSGTFRDCMMMTESR